MDFADRITRWPTPFEPARGAEVAARFGTSGPLYDLICGTAGCSPYLEASLLREEDWIKTALAAPESALADLLPLAPDTQTGPGLRVAKRRMALLVALADLGGVWDLHTVTGALTRFADAALDTALNAGLAPLQARGKLPEAAGMTALAMGKMGAFELNYSSDIDIICLFEDALYSDADLPEVRGNLVRATRTAMKLLSEVTAEGYVFRTDLRLRPDPSVTAICLSVSSAERYYESLGRAWERAAFIKARSAAGDLAAGEAFLAAIKPFVWRRHLDFATIDDAHDMRLKIRENKGLHGPITLPGHNMKLGRGGIREIEFFAQTRQLIAGGRGPALRCRGTVQGLQALAAAGWVPEDLSARLVAAYQAHREVEHRLQMLRDAQTHELPESAEGMARLAAFMGLEKNHLERQLRDDLEATHEIMESFFAPDRASGTVPEFGQEITARWPAYPALRTERAVELFERLKPQILGRFAQAPNPQEALSHFDQFLASLPSGVQVFSLFDANPTLLDLLTDIMVTSPALANYLARHASVFDAVLDGDFFAPWPGCDGLAQALGDGLAAEEDYERQLDAARIWMKEWHFRIGVHHLRGLIDAAEAGGQYADLAEACVKGLLPVVEAEFARKHGPTPGLGAAVLGMGSLGSQCLNAQSDLDLLLIYDAQGQEASEGPRSLAAPTYYARLTQALITAISSLTARGRLYEVDMRLRPSGRHGPVATSVDAFEAYQRNEAWTWEHLALTRARVIAGPRDLAHRIEACRLSLIEASRPAAKTAQDVDDLRTRLFEAKPNTGPLVVKDGPGRMQDIELFAQLTALLSGVPVRQPLEQLPVRATDLADAHTLFWQVQSTLKLTSDAPPEPGDLTQGATAMLLRETGASDLASLLDRISEAAACSSQWIDAALGELGAPKQQNGKGEARA